VGRSPSPFAAGLERTRRRAAAGPGLRMRLLSRPGTLRPNLLLSLLLWRQVLPLLLPLLLGCSVLASRSLLLRSDLLAPLLLLSLLLRREMLLLPPLLLPARAKLLLVSRRPAFRGNPPVRWQFLDLGPLSGSQMPGGPGRQGSPRHAPAVAAGRPGGLGDIARQPGDIPGRRRDIGFAQVGLGPAHIGHPPYRRRAVPPGQIRRLDMADGAVAAHDTIGRPHVSNPDDVVGVTDDGIIDHGAVDVGDPGNIGRRRSKGIGPVP